MTDDVKALIAKARLYGVQESSGSLRSDKFINDLADAFEASVQENARLTKLLDGYTRDYPVQVNARAKAEAALEASVQAPAYASDDALVDQWWESCEGVWAVPDEVMIKFARNVLARWGSVQAPAVDREALAREVESATRLMTRVTPELAKMIAKKIVASGILQDAAEVRKEGDRDGVRRMADQIDRDLFRFAQREIGQAELVDRLAELVVVARAQQVREGTA